MFCRKCGAELNEESSFCPKCGTPVNPDMAQPATAPIAGVPAQPKKNHFALIGAAVALVAVIGVTAVLTNGFGFFESSSTSSSASASASTSSSTPVTPVVTYDYDAHGIRLQLSADLKTKVKVENSTSFDGLVLKDAHSGYTVAEVFVTGSRTGINETGTASWTLGRTTADGASSEVILGTFYYDRTSGAGLYWGIVTTENGESGLEREGITPEQIASCISLNTGSTWAKASCTPSGDDRKTVAPSSSSANNGYPTTAFYGIWVSASKEQSDCDAVVQQLKNSGFSGAATVVTTDWDNLNSERWYVVTAGIYSSEQDANNALSSVQQYYGDAYVKYSGARK